MKSGAKLVAGVFVVSVFLGSCYPEKKILGRYPNGQLKDIRYYKKGDSLTERFVYYYDNGQKQYVRWWKKGVWPCTKMKTWYKSGAKRMEGSFVEKDTSSVYNPADSSRIFTAITKGTYKEWYENGKLKFETFTKDGMLMYNYYNEQGVRTKQEFAKVIRQDGYDTTCIKMEPGKRGVYTKSLKYNPVVEMLLRGDD